MRGMPHTSGAKNTLRPGKTDGSLDGGCSGGETYMLAGLLTRLEKPGTLGTSLLVLAVSIHAAAWRRFNGLQPPSKESN